MPKGQPGSGGTPGIRTYYSLSKAKRAKLGPYSVALGKQLIKEGIAAREEAKKARHNRRATDKVKLANRTKKDIVDGKAKAAKPAVVSRPTMAESVVVD